jgi:hypothetical protein
MKSFPTPLCVLLVFAVFLAGCSGTNTTTVGLKIELAKVARQSNGTTQVTWRVVNPNIVPYLLAEATHRIYLDGVLVGAVNDREAIAIPAQTNQERTTALTVAGPAGESALSAAAKTGSAAYRVESHVLVRLYGDTTEKGDLQGAGTVPVTRE